ncbi:50S ribosomal protein L18 [Candidatus Uhrbacteria bacterium RIFOXYB12_FULL_58_10]|uniref:Large ribosomal subunit protein uL18 n=1 Tax=Candidatus Uhrbacteria bacterium RIFOXYB2_FULL_57_15 TaxID=1802422 RepID=A0A1F7W8C8_9BACT|nr:MAG: 50S ribosomal protein L18 [Candidatus Uhrbacteria bacterium RIFOXYB12_FULL_58_10]OGL99065.1 MAG: 50S ribosomal protein L18 [Candidatus Uhrbacteria bacterium RIFOXYB2_FULL_57_15]OGM00240.1 MAG: 50S ribosomal protein L18 [Candidatus Uhrbacteria bacterium RIFOXYC12_FULL_57_11]
MKSKHERTKRRAHRVRVRIHGTAECPRLSVKRSLKHIYAQLIDDAAGRTLAASSDKDVSEKGKPVETAKIVGMKLAEKAKAAGIEQVVFDRGSNRYIGRVAALAEGAREGGLNF